jgi:hypothetical protein
LRSLEAWRTKPSQTLPDMPLSRDLRMLFTSMWTQGVRSKYRRAYWSFLRQVLGRYWGDPVKRTMGLALLVTAHHFLIYARQVADDLERACDLARERGDAALVAEPATT